MSLGVTLPPDTHIHTWRSIQENIAFLSHKGAPALSILGLSGVRNISRARFHTFEIKPPERFILIPQLSGMGCFLSCAALREGHGHTDSDAVGSGDDTSSTHSSMPVLADWTQSSVPDVHHGTWNPIPIADYFDGTPPCHFCDSFAADRYWYDFNGATVSAWSTLMTDQDASSASSVGEDAANNDSDVSVSFYFGTTYEGTLALSDSVSE